MLTFRIGANARLAGAALCLDTDSEVDEHAPPTHTSQLRLQLRDSDGTCSFYSLPGGMADVEPHEVVACLHSVKFSTHAAPTGGLANACT